MHLLEKELLLGSGGVHWWCAPLIPGLGGNGSAVDGLPGLQIEFQARATLRNPVSKKGDTPNMFLLCAMGHL